ncbi:MAG: hypothetical protein COW00_12660 [Bdellovibrio sp. CG12_big_fil_rev_8_21_14_0_65_39_13]|nr:MAG: hypothetical protein COW78_06950 [Bdellovibrio sp. CG22_combo_CG10-13_8_21_14_all_39_27]PIQ59035.1 MAG: hypothetical protein COW00_12660 [Bdellovibrio sp. CG12_big_fil_rev_8_21_14_0_65_39_13]PIR33011.1 MAG: hypothetical protein COV37_18120 [Bdellovibrio sp. CG11_big_fil_rev_8_21_14_0_20_39_38]
MKNEKEKIILDHFVKKYVVDERDKVEILLTKEGTIVGNIISSSFRNLSANEQQNQLEAEIESLKKDEKINCPLFSALLLYSPEEFYMMPASDQDQIKGLLKTIDINTLGASDLVVRITEDNWRQITAKADFSEEETMIPFEGEVHRAENSHLFQAIDLIFDSYTYKFFEAEGYQFDGVSGAKFLKMLNNDVALIMFSAKQMPLHY